MQSFTTITLTAFAIIFAAIAVLATSTSAKAADFYTVAAFAVSVLAVIIAWIAFLRAKN